MSKFSLPKYMKCSYHRRYVCGSYCKPRTMVKCECFLSLSQIVDDFLFHLIQTSSNWIILLLHSRDQFHQPIGEKYQHKKHWHIAEKVLFCYTIICTQVWLNILICNYWTVVVLCCICKKSVQKSLKNYS